MECRPPNLDNERQLKNAAKINKKIENSRFALCKTAIKWLHKMPTGSGRQNRSFYIKSVVFLGKSKGLVGI
jgi:hypothetical protein